jgi:hypothetical protein
MCFRCMLHMFYLDIAYVARLYKYAASICFTCFKCMLQVFYLDVTYVALAIHECCKCMFQMFQLFQTYVASVLSRCCICYSAHTHMLQTYVVSVLSVLDICCSKCFMLQVFHEQARQGGASEGGPLGRNGPRMRVGSEADATASA